MRALAVIILFLLFAGTIGYYGIIPAVRNMKEQRDTQAYQLESMLDGIDTEKEHGLGE